MLRRFLRSVYQRVESQTYSAPRRRVALTLEPLEDRLTPSSASPFKVFGTGLDASGHALTDGAADPHYALLSGPSTAAPVVMPQGGFPFPYWAADDSNSAWITPGDAPNNASNGYQEAEGDYVYETTFDLTGYDSATAAIHGLLGADNTVTQVLLNGQDAGYQASNAGNNFSSLNALDVTSGFTAGLNKLDFVVHNDAGDSWNPTGFRAELSGTAQLAAPTVAALATGTDGQGDLLAAGAQDPNWRLVSAPAPVATGAPHVTINNGFPFDHWTANDQDSQWVSPEANENDTAGGATDPVGTYTYQTTFDLTGYDPSTATLAGYVSADNMLEKVLLNGQDVGYTPDPSGTDYTAMHPIAITSGFQGGVNTLQFVVYNAPQGDGSDNAHNPNAFRAELTAAAAPVPALYNPGAQVNVVGDQVALPVGDAYGALYSASGLPSGLSIDPGSGSITGKIVAGADGGSPYTVTVTATEGAESASQTFAWTVAHFAIHNPGDQTDLVGDGVYLPTGGADPDGDGLTFTATNLPPGLGVESDNGLITGTINADAADATPYAVTLTASDGAHTASQTFNWTVTHVFVVSPGDRQNADGDTVNLPIEAGDNYGAAVTVTAAGLPPGLTVDDGGNIVGVISDTADATSPYTVTLTATDGTYSASQTFQWAVGRLLLNSPGDQTNNDGDAVSLQLTTDDNLGDSLFYSAAGLPDGLGVAADTGLISGAISPTADAAGPYTVTVTATGGGASSSQTFTWYVNNPVSIDPVNDQSNALGDAVSLTVSGTPPPGATLTYTAAGLPDGLTIDGATGLISGVIAATASITTPYDVTVTAADGQIGASTSFVWTVSYLTLANPGDQANVVGDVVSLPTGGSDPEGAATYSASNLPPGLGVDPTTGTISGVVSAAAVDGVPYAVTLTATDGAYSASQTFNWTVTHVALVNPGDQQNYDGDAVQLALGGGNNGAAVTYSADGLPPGLTINQSGQVVGTISDAADLGGPYDVTVSATDGTYDASQSFIWYVSDPLTVTSPGDEAFGDGAVNLQIAATDADGRTLSYSALGLPSWLSIDQATGLITGHVVNGVTTAEQFASRVVVSDGIFSQALAVDWRILMSGLGTGTVFVEISADALPAKTIGEAQAVANSGVPVDKSVTDVAGPDVTDWYAADLIQQLKWRYEHQGIKQFQHQARDLMSYKWIDFGTPTTGKGVNTVVLGDFSLAKKQLGNLAFMIVPTVFRPSNEALDAAQTGKAWLGEKPAKWTQYTMDHRQGKPSSALERVAWIGYLAADPEYGPEAKEFGDFPDNATFRADNLAAFGVGRMIGWQFVQAYTPTGKDRDPDQLPTDQALDTIAKKLETKEGQADLTTTMAKILRQVFSDTKDANQQMAIAVDSFRKFQPVPNAPKITTDALFFTPDYNGFNLNSLVKKGAPVFAPTAPVSSIGAATAIIQLWRKDHPGGSAEDPAFFVWRKAQFENWTKESGIKMEGITYP